MVIDVGMVVYMLLKFFFQTHLPICSECLGTDKNAEGIEEALSECAGCGACVHLTCVSLPGSTTTNQFIALLSQPGAAWFCEECRTCCKCEKVKEQVCLIMLLFIFYYLLLYLVFFFP